jgi:hypothetical protein
MYMEAEIRVPIVSRWPAIARFLAAHRDQVGSLTSPDVAKLCERWLAIMPLEIASGMPTPHRKEFAEVALASAKCAQFEQIKSRFAGYAGASPIYKAALAGARELPDEVSTWALEMARRRLYGAELSKRISEYRRQQDELHKERLKSDPDYRARRKEAVSISIPSSRKLPPWALGPGGRVESDFRECCVNSNALVPLMGARPEVAAEILLAAIIDDSPKEEYGSSPRFDDGFGLESDRHSYPTAYWKSQFLSFLQINPNVALDALIALVNFCTERWISEWRRHSKESHPQIAIRLDDGSERIFAGNHIVFDWAQINSNRAGQLHSGLAALERWLCLAIDSGNEISPYIDRILRTSNSVSLLGVLINVGKYRPDLFKSDLRLLITIERLYRWDDYRKDALQYHSVGEPWARQGEVIFQMAKNWYLAPYRQQALRSVVPKLAMADPELNEFVGEATGGWEELADAKAALDLRILKAEIDGRNYRSVREDSLRIS